MNLYHRVAIMVCRLVAGGFCLVGVMDLTAYWLKCRHDHTDLNAWRCVRFSIPIVIGVALLVKSNAIARRIEQYLDEN